MPKYGMHVANFSTPTTTADTALAVTANAAAEEGEIVYLSMTGSGTATAADRQHRALLLTNTSASAGTSTAVTPEPFNQGSAAADMEGSSTFTAEPSTLGTVALVAFGFNQRGGMPWGVPQGEGAQIRNSGTDKGYVWAVVSDAAGAVDANLHWWEP